MLKSMFPPIISLVRFFGERFLGFFKTSRLFPICLVVGIAFIGIGAFSDVFAQVNQLDLGLQFAENTGLTKTDIRVVVARIINIALGLLGLVAVVIVLYGGVVWMTSQGESSKIDSAKRIIMNGVIGLLIILSAFGITEFIFRMVIGDSYTTFNSNSGSGYGAGGGAHFGGGALGKVIRSHYPDRNAQDIPRNTRVVVTFAEKMKDDTIFDAQALNRANLNFKNVKIYKNIDAKSGNLPPDEAKLLKDVQVATTDNITYVFSFAQYLGSPSEKISYTVHLGAGIQKSNGNSIFGSTYGDYAWSFTTSTSIDITPPQIQSISPKNILGCPADSEKCAPRNEVIQIHFNEAIDPTTVTGLVPGFVFIKTSPQVQGEFLISNQYRTVTFLPKAPCGSSTINSCGKPVYCLPGNVKIEVKTIAAALDPAASDASQAKIPYNGVVDMSGNSLDGQGGLKNTPPLVPNGKAEGSPTDDFAWEFYTNDKVDLIPPVIKSIKPDVNGQKISLNQNVEIEFTKELMSTSIFGSFDFRYGLSTLTDPTKLSSWLGAQRADLEIKNNVVNPYKIVWTHYDGFFPSVGNQTYYYYPKLFSSIQDTRQNCFNPSAGPIQTGSGIKCEYLQGDQWNSSKVGVYPVCDLSL